MTLITLTALPQSVRTPTFEVASVKPDPTTAGSYVRYLPGGRLSALSWIEQVIHIAYGIKDYQVVGGPDWLTTEWYAIEAKAESPDASTSDINAMLQSLLAERFELKFHRETRSFDGYDLVVDKNGSKLTPLPLGEKSKCNRENSYSCGTTSPSQLAGDLTSILGRPVFDKTEISGRFDVLLNFDTYAARGRTPPEGYDKPSLSEALKDQLGLRLEPHKESLLVLVVDSIKRPTAN